MTAQTAEQPTIHDFIAKHGLIMQSEPADGNPHMTNMAEGSRHFVCTVVRDVRSMQTQFSVGPGIVDQWISQQLGQQPGKRAFKTGWPSISKKDFDTARRAQRLSTHDAKTLERARNYGKHYRPELADVLDCLASDASGVEGQRFEDWAADYGYNTDSRKAERIFHACRNTYHDLQYLLGNDALQELLYETERL